MQALLRALRVTAAGAPDATFLRARISRAAATGRLLLRQRRREPSVGEARGSDGADMGDGGGDGSGGGGGGGGGGSGGSGGGGDVLVPAAIAVLRGDALVTAHYRLGIGVNAAFRTLQGWQVRRVGAWLDSVKAFQSWSPDPLPGAAARCVGARRRCCAARRRR
eukprot:scaffold81952_cov61-Phaeocystis_antarctica.AAC.12